MPSPSSVEPTTTTTTRKATRRRSSIAERLNSLDETLSQPVFRLGLPKWIELVFSVPANFFGTTFAVVACPGWIALLTLLLQPRARRCYYDPGAASGSGDDADAEQDDRLNNQARIGLLAVLTLGVSLVYVVAWTVFFQVRKRHELALGFFWNHRLFDFACLWSVAVLAGTVGGLTPTSGRTACRGNGPWSPASVLSVSLYPLVLWPVVVFVMNSVKKAAGRHRPAKKDRERRDSFATKRKSYPLITRILAVHNGTASFPSGDVMCATLVAIPLWEVGLEPVAVAIVSSSALGRMYVLAHHLADVAAGFAITVGIHRLASAVASSAGASGIRGTAWWHPLLANALAVGAKRWTNTRSPSEEERAGDDDESKES